MKVLLAGGTGFIGRHCAAALRLAGHEVTCGSRSSPEFAVNFADPPDPSAFGGFEAIVNLVGIAVERGRNTFEHAHETVPRNLVELARRHRIERLIHIGVVDVTAEPGNPAERYRETKRRGEAIVMGSDLAWTILRPGLVYGPGDDMMTNLVRMIRLAPVFVVPARGGPLQLVDVEDVAHSVVLALREPNSVRRTLDIVGPQRIALPALCHEVARALELPLRVIELPRAWMRLGSRLPGAPVTPTQLGMLEAGLYGDAEAAAATLGFRPRPLSEGRISALASGVPRSPATVRLLPTPQHREWLRRCPAIPWWFIAAAVALLLVSPLWLPNVWLRMGLCNAVLTLAALTCVALPWRELLRPRVRDLAWGAAIGAVTGLVTTLVISLGDALGLPWLPDRLEIYAWARDISPLAFLPALAAIVVGEDLVWRAAITLPLSARWGPVLGCLTAGGLFALAHATSGPGLLIVAALLLGTFWSALVLRTRSVLLASTCHLVWDLWMLGLAR